MERHLEWRSRLLAWYDQVARDLPWRQDTDPYHVWVSEIMLQQTRIEAAMGYYHRFMADLPTLQDLAAVEEDALLKLWEGLGYYSRARNLKKAAIIVTDEFGGNLPADYASLLSLPGIGEYTAGAIASISFGIPVPAVDGNVLRVLARLTAHTGDVLKTAIKKELSTLAAQTVSPERPGAYNQAIMELGETVCIPNAAPYCDKCPLADLCEGYRLGIAASLPTRSPQKEKRVEERTVAVILCEQDGNRKVLLHRRPSTGLLANLWELPALKGFCDKETVTDWAEKFFHTDVQLFEKLPNAKHIFSHIEWHMQAVLLKIKFVDIPDGYAWVDAVDLATGYALPSAFRTYAKLLPSLLNGES